MDPSESREIKIIVVKRKVGRPPKSKEEKKVRYNAYHKKYQVDRYKTDEGFRKVRKQACINYRAKIKPALND